MNSERGSMKEITFYSQELNEELSLIIYLPPNFSNLYKYSLLIAQDGKDYFQLGRFTRTCDSLIQSGKIENIIAVGIPYKDVNDRRSKYHPSGEKHGAYIRFLAHELIPYLEREFPVYHVNSCRVLAGDSLAGTVSFLTALSYPHTFGKVMLHSPFVNDEVIQKVRQFKNPDLLSIYHVIGKQETAVKMTNGEISDFLEPNRHLHKAIKDVGIPHFYDEFDGEHTWKYWQADLPRALTYMFGK